MPGILRKGGSDRQPLVSYTPWLSHDQTIAGGVWSEAKATETAIDFVNATKRQFLVFG